MSVNMLEQSNMASGWHSVFNTTAALSTHPSHIYCNIFVLPQFRISFIFWVFCLFIVNESLTLCTPAE